MPEAQRPIHPLPAARRIGVVLLGLMGGAAAWASDEPRPAPDLAESLKRTSGASHPLNLLLTQAELRTVIRNYEDRTGEIHTAPISDEEILVTAPGVQAPMRDVSQDVMGGIAAPFWALAHPTQGWRIFVPIPPKGERVDERPAPDPR